MSGGAIKYKSQPSSLPTKKCNCVNLGHLVLYLDKQQRKLRLFQVVGSVLLLEGAEPDIGFKVK